MATKPTDAPEWATVGAAIVEPLDAKKELGWVVGEKPPAQYFNWLLNNLYLWQQYFEDVTDGALGVAKRSYFNLEAYAQGSSSATLSFAKHNSLICCTTNSGDGQFRKSADNGKTWTAVTIPSAGNMFGLASNSSRILSVGSGAFMATSDDNGDTWTTRTSAIAAVALSGAAYGTSKWVAISQTGTAIQNSSDAITWTARTSALTGSDNMFGVAYGNSRFAVAATAGKIMTSSNEGDTWALTYTAPSGKQLNCIMYDPIIGFVALGEDGYGVYSADGITWQDLGQVGTVRFRGIKSDGAGLIVAYDIDGDIWFSGDGINFIEQNTSLPALSSNEFLHMNPVGYIDGNFLFGSNSSGLVYRSDNFHSVRRDVDRATGYADAGIARTAFNLEAHSHGQGSISTSRFVSHGGYLFLALYDGKVSRSSDNGKTWINKNIETTTYETRALVSDGASTLVAATGETALFTSANNGDTWVERTNVFANQVTNGAWGASIFVLISDNAEIASSPTGATWTTRTSAMPADALRGIAFGDSKFVIVGGNKAQSSANGTTWTLRFTGGAADLYTVAYDPFIGFVATGLDGSNAKSVDGITWKEGNAIPGIPDIYDSKSNGNGLIVCTDALGKIWHTGDGINFHPQKEVVPSADGVVGYNSGFWYFGGNAGSIYRADSLHSLRADIETNTTTLATQNLLATLSRLTTFTSFSDTLTLNSQAKISYVSNAGNNYLLFIGNGDDVVRSDALAVDLSLPAGLIFGSKNGAIAFKNVAADSAFGVAVGPAGQIYTSPAPYATWTSRTSGIATSLYPISVGGGWWIVYGETGVNGIRYNDTTDPTDAWSGSTSGLDGGTSFIDAAFGAGLHVAITFDSEIITTANPSGAWTLRTNPVTPVTAWNGLSFDGTRFWAWGQNGEIITSTNGIDWVDVSIASGGTIMGVFTLTSGGQTIYVCAESNTSSIRYNTALDTSWATYPIDDYHFLSSVDTIFTYIPQMGRLFAKEISNAELIYSKMII